MTQFGVLRLFGRSSFRHWLRGDHLSVFTCPPSSCVHEIFLEPSIDESSRNLPPDRSRHMPTALTLSRAFHSSTAALLVAPSSPVTPRTHVRLKRQARSTVTSSHRDMPPLVSYYSAAEVSHSPTPTVNRHCSLDQLLASWRWLHAAGFMVLASCRWVSPMMALRVHGAAVFLSILDEPLTHRRRHHTRRHPSLCHWNYPSTAFIRHTSFTILLLVTNSWEGRRWALTALPTAIFVPD